jgi:hypothetical protein
MHLNQLEEAGASYVYCLITKKITCYIPPIHYDEAQILLLNFIQLNICFNYMQCYLFVRFYLFI